MIHAGANEASPFEILDILEAEGADLSHTVMGHIDRTIQDRRRLLELARRGCYVELDLFGMECSYYQVSGEEEEEEEEEENGTCLSCISVEDLSLL